MFLFFGRYAQSIIQIIVWVFLFFYPFLFHYLPINDVHAIWRVSIFLLVLMAFFYANTLFFIPRLLSRKLFFAYFLSVLIFIIFICFCTAYAQIFLNPHYSKNPDLFKTAVYTGIISSLLVWFISSGIKITSEWLKNQHAVRAKENERLNAELNLLKLQVNPHFLFNALNNIYALQNKKSSETGNAILMLSELIRYMMYDTLSEFVPLKNEIKYLHNYIELQKLGISNRVKINFTVEGDVENKQIEPMLLIPIVENVFKHGISYTVSYPDFIKIHSCCET